MAFGKRLRLLRNENNLTLRELEKQTGITYSALGKYERDERQPDFDTLEKLADHFDVSIDWLLARTDLRTYDERVFFDDVNHLAEKIKTIPKEYRKSIVNSIDALYLLLNRQIRDDELDKLLIIEDIICSINWFDMGWLRNELGNEYDLSNPTDIIKFHSKFNSTISELSNELLSRNISSHKIKGFKDTDPFDEES
ncbi:hypothetical protein EP18_03780 [Lysinibacillus sphaericus]|nr:helix-turn-helix transcriptional regulator [Lysinibacillus sphaericus]KEK12994.1 hypothetical protein EP18_03780 [Lysinibacillus sphaericus]